MTVKMAKNKQFQGELEVKERALWEEEQRVIDALEHYLSQRSLDQQHPLLQWIMW